MEVLVQKLQKIESRVLNFEFDNFQDTEYVKIL